MITSHGWADDTSRVRIQALGGFVAPYASTTTNIGEWRKARASHSTASLRGSDSAPTRTALASKRPPGRRRHRKPGDVSVQQL